MNIAFFGSSLVSAFWNGTATYYRGIVRALHERGHNVTFYEPDVYMRQQYRDLEPPPWVHVVVYRPEKFAVEAAVESAREADVIVKASNVGVLDEFLEAGVLGLKTPENVVVYWDVDPPATLARIAGDPADPFIGLIPRYDAILTCGGGEVLSSVYKQRGARRCATVYNALDPATHFPGIHDGRYAGDVAFLGNRLPDQDSRVDEFLLKPAAELPQSSFLLGGSGWDGKARTPNIRYVGHVYTDDHNSFNSTPRAVLNISREGEAEWGYSPTTRLFEAAGAGACIITDRWDGLEEFFEPGDEVLVVQNGAEVAELVRSLTWAEAEKIGHAAQQRALWQHTYGHRAQAIEAFLERTRVGLA